jgi:hypothetical protein
MVVMVLGCELKREVDCRGRKGGRKGGGRRRKSINLPAVQISETLSPYPNVTVLAEHSKPLVAEREHADHAVRVWQLHNTDTSCNVKHLYD